MIALWLPLWSLIGPDEGFIFLIIVFTFFITISIVVKFRSQSNTSCTTMYRHHVAQESMALAQNPFQFRLSVLKDEVNDEVDNDLNNKEDKNLDCKTDEETSKSDKKEDFKTDDQPTTSQLNDDENIDDFKKGVKVDIFCKIDYYLCYYWGVNIDQFHNFMRLNSQSFNDRIFDGSLFDQNYLEKNEPKLINGTNQVKTMKLTCSDKVNPETLGQSPRTCYPLVVILARDLSKNEDNKNENDVVFMINVIHVKDKVCPLETNVITRLLKKRNGLTINLQTLYTTNEFDESTGTNTAICVICQESLVSIALLPCKHTCTCLECFEKIDKCPLCRSYIRSYFMLKIDNESNNQSEENNLNNDQNQNSTNQSTPPQTTATNEPTTSTSTNNQNSRGSLLKRFGNKITNLFR